MSTPQALVETLLMKSILGQELTDTKFHFFSGRSVHTRQLTRLQALWANDVVLTSRSEFFAECKLAFHMAGYLTHRQLVLSKTESSDATFVDFDCGSIFEGDMVPDNYGYESDSDLEDEVEGQASQMSASDKTVDPDGKRLKYISTT